MNSNVKLAQRELEQAFNSLEKEIPELADLFEILKADDKTFEAFYPEIEKTIAQMKKQPATMAPAGMTREKLEEEIKLLLELKEDEAFNVLSDKKREFINLLADSAAEEMRKMYFREKVGVDIVVGENGTIPTYAHEVDACADIYSAETHVYQPGESYTLETDIKIDVPEGYVVHIYPRSGLSAKTGLRLNNSVGVIDCGYKDSIKVMLTNTYNTEVTVNKGDRIAQMCIDRSPMIEFNQVEALKTDNDRQGGLGSTGK